MRFHWISSFTFILLMGWINASMAATTALFDCKGIAATTAWLNYSQLVKNPKNGQEDWQYKRLVCGKTYPVEPGELRVGVAYIAEGKRRDANISYQLHDGSNLLSVEVVVPGSETLVQPVICNTTVQRRRVSGKAEGVADGFGEGVDTEALKHLNTPWGVLAPLADLNEFSPCTDIPIWTNIQLSKPQCRVEKNIRTGGRTICSLSWEADKAERTALEALRQKVVANHEGNTTQPTIVQASSKTAIQSANAPSVAAKSALAPEAPSDEIRYPDGGIYKGGIVNGRRHGYGVMKYANGDSYDGSWSNDLYDGYGELKRKSSWSYVGEWEDGKREGQGRVTYPQNGWMEGSWSDDKPTGEMFRHENMSREYIRIFSNEGVAIGQRELDAGGHSNSSVFNAAMAALSQMRTNSNNTPAFIQAQKNGMAMVEQAQRQAQERVRGGETTKPPAVTNSQLVLQRQPSAPSVTQLAQNTPTVQPDNGRAPVFAELPPCDFKTEKRRDLVSVPHMKGDTENACKSARQIAETRTNLPLDATRQTCGTQKAWINVEFASCSCEQGYCKIEWSGDFRATTPLSTTSSGRGISK